MKIGFISFAIPGHFNPMSALARQLQSRHHDVVMFSLPVGESLARAANLPFVPFGEKEFPAEHSSEALATGGRLKGEEGLRVTVSAIAASTEGQCRTLPNGLSSHGIHARVVVNYEFY